MYCHLYILGKEATISSFEGLDYVERMPEVMHLTQMKKVGDKIGIDGTTAQKVVGLHMKVDSMEHLKQILRDIEKHVYFYDEDGNDLTIYFDSDKL